MSLVQPGAATLEAWWRHLEARVEPRVLLERLTAGSLSQAFSSVATREGDRPALTINEVTVSHTELDDRAARIGGWLRSKRIGRGSRVLIVGPSSHELVCAYLGTLRCGASAVPVDAAVTRAELAQLVADAEPAAAFVATAPARHLSSAPAERQPRTVIGLEPEAVRTTIAEIVSNDPIEPAEHSMPAILAYTSGTTGEPKGVPLSDANVLSSIRAAMLAWRWSRSDVLVHALPLSHQHGLGGLHATLLAGSHLVLERSFRPESFCARVQSAEATVIMAVPAIYERLDAWDGIGDAGLESLRLAVSGSGPLPVALAKRVAKWLGEPPLERYGSTEAGLMLSNLYAGPRRPGRVGYPLPGIEVRLVGEDGAEVSPGDDGEIFVRGPQVFDGYWCRPDATEDAFEGEWFRSGDIGRMHAGDGDVAITGRLKEMIISGGLNVFPGEVELVLNQHPAIAQSAVAGVPSELWGEEVVAFVVGSRRQSLEPPSVIDHCRKRLSDYKCPKRVIEVSKLPRNEIGKVLREELVELALADRVEAEDR